MSNDVDFDQFIKLLDGALASDDKNVKQALRKFLFVAAMVMGDDTEPGPFTEMMETIDSLQQRLATLEMQVSPTTSAPSVWPQNTWKVGTGQQPPFTSPSTTGGSTGPLTGGTATSNGYITYTNTTGNTGTITLPNATSTTLGGTYTVPNNTTTTTAVWYDMGDPTTGTSIKDKIKKGLEKLAKST
ncbi:MAG: hypothetical protein V3R41_00395 [Gammaproteobacteria bacterium]